MLCRVTPSGAFIRKRAGATGSLPCHPRRTFSATRAQHATHYETLSIPGDASKSQIKVSTSPQIRLCASCARPLVCLLQGTHATPSTKYQKPPTVFLFLFFVLWFDGSIKRLIYTISFSMFFPFVPYSLVEQAVPSGHKQRSPSEGEVCSIQRGVRCSRKR